MAIESYDVMFWLLREPGTRLVSDVEAANWADAAAIARDALDLAGGLAFVAVLPSPVTWMGTIETLPPRIFEGEGKAKIEVFLDDGGQKIEPGGLLTGNARSRFRRYTILGLMMSPDGEYHQDRSLTQVDKVDACSWSAAAHTVNDLHNQRRLEHDLPTEYMFVGAIRGDVRLAASHGDMTALLLEWQRDQDLTIEDDEREYA